MWGRVVQDWAGRVCDPVLGLTSVEARCGWVGRAWDCSTVDKMERPWM